jgi:protein-S-isoprenylcysteine O-methyltransferase Ste14
MAAVRTCALARVDRDWQKSRSLHRSLERNVMDVTTIMLILAVTIWAILEASLILRDYKRDKRVTAADSRTRVFNIFSMTFSPALAAIVTSIPILKHLGVRNIYVFGAGIGILTLGLGLRIWAIAVLGSNFRTTVGVEQGQKVVQSGPYHYIRHPSYAGYILICMGYGVALQNAVSFIIMATLPTIALLHRIEIEERALTAVMGEAYLAYQKRCKKIIPGIW